MHVDWSAADRPMLSPGTYLVTVKECKEGISKKGDAFFNVRLNTESFDGRETTLCFDILMMEGKGAGIGLAKLQALGIPKGTADVSAQDLIGRRAWVNVDSQTYDGKTHLKVYTTFDPFELGYWPESEPPDGVSEPSVSIKPDEDVPF